MLAEFEYVVFHYWIMSCSFFALCVASVALWYAIYAHKLKVKYKIRLFQVSYSTLDKKIDHIVFTIKNVLRPLSNVKPCLEVRLPNYNYTYTWEGSEISELDTGIEYNVEIIPRHPPDFVTCCNGTHFHSVKWENAHWDSAQWHFIIKNENQILVRISIPNKHIRNIINIMRQ